MWLGIGVSVDPTVGIGVLVASPVGFAVLVGLTVGAGVAVAPVVGTGVADVELLMLKSPLGWVAWHTVQVSSGPLWPCRLMNLIASFGWTLGAIACGLSWHAAQ